MLTYICRCCAAPLDVKSGMTVCRCSYCDVLQTIPRLDHDEKAVLWERAEALRRGGEYDRALSLYGELLELDGTDPDIYWSMTLCRYGVDYVEEQGSRRRIPTLNRIQYKPVIEDEDYRTATRLADGEQRRVYMDEAMRLEALRKDIIEVSMTEQPYDIFICYKETDSSGRRTEDSVLAGRLYRALTAEGWRVFFARVSLEDKAGTMFEPYIFAALNSARLMLAVGTSPENFNAVWVRNEWSRYLNRMSEKGEGALVVMYKGMLSEHLPEEFSHLQRIDMSQSDFTEELIRGARKLLNERQSPAASAPVEVSEDGERVIGVTADTLLRRAKLALEDEEYESAWQFCERALDAEPESAGAYLMQLLAEYKVGSVEALAGVSGDFTTSGRYKKYVRFADPESAARLQDIHKNTIYTRCCEELNRAHSESMLLALAESFRGLGNYLDSASLAEDCERRAENAKMQQENYDREEKYLSAKSYYEVSESIANLTTAKRMFTELGDYKDSAALATQCEQMIAELNAELEQQNAVIEAERLQAIKRHKLKMKITAILFAAVAVVGIVVLVITMSSWSIRYSNAVDMREAGEYAEAIASFQELSGYYDSPYQLQLTKYEQAKEHMAYCRYKEAIDIFEQLSGFSDSYDKVQECRLLYVDQLADNGRYSEALVICSQLDDEGLTFRTQLRYANYLAAAKEHYAAAQIYHTLGETTKYRYHIYMYAEQLAAQGDYLNASAYFENLSGYNDAYDKSREMKYAAAEQYEKDGDLLAAAKLFDELGKYSDSKERKARAYYDYGEKCFSEKDYENAVKYFGQAYPLNDVDVTSRRDEATYLLAQENVEKGMFDEAIKLFYSLGNYSDAAEYIDKARFLKAQALIERKSYNEAFAILKELGNYDGAKTLAEQIREQALESARAGDTIWFGSWHTAADGTPAELEWRVLERDDDKLFLLCRDIIDCRQFGSAGYWNQSELRTWLNEEFINSAFSAQEQQRISLTKVTFTSTRYNSDTHSQEITTLQSEDKIYLLSDNEIHRYDLEQEQSDYTEYGAVQYVSHNTADQHSDEDCWWLRDRKTSGVEVKYCDDYFATTAFHREYHGVRPVMWIEVGD